MKHIITTFEKYKILEQQETEAELNVDPALAPEEGTESAPAPEAEVAPEAPAEAPADLFATAGISQEQFETEATPFAAGLQQEIAASAPTEAGPIVAKIKAFVLEKLKVDTKELVKYGEQGSAVLKTFEPVLQAMSAAGVPTLTESRKK